MPQLSTVVTPPDRPKSTRNRCVIECFDGVFVLSLSLFILYMVQNKNKVSLLTEKTARQREKGRELTQSYDKIPYTISKQKKIKRQHKKRHQQKLITQPLQTDLSRSVGVTTANQLVCLNRFMRS